MRSDLDIKRDVEDELISDPDVVATDVGVAVKDGVVTVTGFVRSFRQRRTIEEDVKRVAGVTGVVNNIDVRIAEGMLDSLAAYAHFYPPFDRAAPARSQGRLRAPSVRSGALCLLCIALHRARLTGGRPIAAQCLAVLFIGIAIGQLLTGRTKIDIVRADGSKGELTVHTRCQSTTAALYLNSHADSSDKSFGAS
jgi:hypothetical protein